MTDSSTLLNACLAACAILCLPGCSKSPPAAPVRVETHPTPSISEPWFEEVAARAGIDFRFSTGHQPGRYYMPEVKGGGVGLLDYDGDGLLDLFCVQAGSLDPAVTNRPSHKLYRNLATGNSRMSPEPRVSRETALMASAAPVATTMAMAFGYLHHRAGDEHALSKQGERDVHRCYTLGWSG